MKTEEKARFDTRLSREQKELFEYAAKLGGYRTLTEFVISTVQERATKIVEEHKAVLASRKDQEFFFEAIMNPPDPNKKLKSAAAKYNQATEK